MHATIGRARIIEDKDVRGIGYLKVPMCVKLTTQDDRAAADSFMSACHNGTVRTIICAGEDGGLELVLVATRELKLEVK